MTFPAQLKIPSEVLKIAKTIEDAGFETWCVGGAIRDNLLAVENHDFDLTTAARPEKVQELFRRTIPVGIEHGTVAVLDAHRTPHEVTTFRKDIKTDAISLQKGFFTVSSCIQILLARVRALLLMLSNIVFEIPPNSYRPMHF